MKNRKILVSIFIVFSLIFVALIFASDFAIRYVIEKNIILFNSDHSFRLKDFDISFSDFEARGIGKIRIEGLDVKYREERFVSADEVEVKIGIKGLLNLFRGSQIIDFNFDCCSGFICVTDNLYDYIAGNKKDSNSIKKLLEKFNVSGTLKDFAVDLNFEGNRIYVKDDFYLSFALKTGINLVDFYSSAPELYIYLSNKEINCNFVNVELKSKGLSDCFFETDSVLINTESQISKMSANFSISEEKVSGTLLSEHSNFKVNKIDTLISELSADILLNFSDKNDSHIYVDCNSIESTRDSSSLIINNLGLSYSFKAQEITHYSDSFVSFDTADIYDVDELYISQAHLNSFYASINRTDNYYNKVELHTYANGNCTDSAIGDFSGELYCSSGIKDFKDYLSINNYFDSHIELSNYFFKSMPGHNNIICDSKLDDFINVRLNINDCINGDIKYEFESNLSDIRLYLNDFRPYDYICNLDFIPHSIKDNIDKDTGLDGSFILAANADIQNLNGRVSFNVVSHDVLFAGAHRNFAASFEANSVDSIINVDTMAISGFGKRISYSGIYDLKKYFPEGKLVLQNSLDGKEIAQVTFELNQFLKGYNIFGSFGENTNDVISAQVNWNDENIIDMDLYFRTDSYQYDFDFNYDKNDKHLSLVHNESFIDSKMSAGILDLIIKLKNFELHFKNNIIFMADGDVVVKFNSNDNNLFCEGKNILFRISDILSLGFDFECDDKDISFANFSIISKDEEMKFDGKALLSIRSVKDLLKGITRRTDFVANFNRINSADYIYASLKENNYSLELSTSYKIPLYISLLGSRGNGFFAQCSIGDISFESRYKSNRIEFYNGGGNLSLIDFDSFGLDIDFVNRTLNGQILLENIKQNYCGDVIQKGLLNVDAKLDSLVFGALSLAGIDVKADFSLGLRNAFLGDEFPIKDNDINVTISRNGIIFDGDIIKGFCRFEDKYIDLNIDKSFLFGFNLHGYVGNEIDCRLSDIYMPANLANQFINFPFVTIIDGYLEGSVLAVGPVNDISFYGNLYSQALDLSIFYLPNQTLSLKDVVFSVVDHSIRLLNTSFTGFNSSDGNFFTSALSLDAELSAGSLENLRLNLDLSKNPVNLWIPLNLDSPLNINTYVLGSLSLWHINGETGIDADITAYNGSVSFSFTEVPDWFYRLKLLCSANIKLITGKNFEFYYPDKDNAFLNFTVGENQVVNLSYSQISGIASAIGDLKIKSGRVSYINNDFTITDGKFHLYKPFLKDGIDFNLDLTAKLKEYDDKGQRVDIYLLLNKASIDNFVPRFESIPRYSQNEIVNILGQSVIPQEGENITLNKLANAAAVATDAVTSLGLVNYDKNYSIEHVIRDTLNLDVFSFRSPVVQNIIINSMPGTITSNSLLSRYLNGTSIFVGKYLNDALFFRMTLLLKEAKQKQKIKNYGHFLSDDLNLDVEMSIDWDNELGDFSVFMQPDELSVSNFLDTIGFSVSKRFVF